MQSSGIYDLGPFGRGVHVDEQGALLVEGLDIGTVSSGVLSTKDINYWRHVGNFDAFGEIFYTGATSTANLSTSTPVVDRLSAIAFFSVRGATLGSIQFEVTSAAASGGLAKIGIYKAVGDTNVFPSGLIFESGNIDVTSTGIKSIDLTGSGISLKENTLYWFAYMGGTAAATVRVAGGLTMFPMFGWAPGGGSDMDYAIFRNAVGFGSFPDPFPSNAARTDSSSSSVVIGVTYAS